MGSDIIARKRDTNLREGAVVPDVTVVRKAVPDVAQSPLLDILLDGIERFFRRDLHLGVGPARNLNDHVEDAIVHIGEERNVMEGGNG